MASRRDFLRGLGLSGAAGLLDIRPTLAAEPPALAASEIDLTVNYATNTILQIDAGDPVLLVAGVHVGCYERTSSGS